MDRHNKASILEIVGAWLHVWTPPRDAEIPPVPWRKLALWGGIGAALLGVALAIMLPRIDAGKQERAAQAAAEQARARAANRARVTELQQPRTGEFAALAPAAGATAAEVAAARAELLAGVEAAITADARKRAAAGEITAVEGPTTCEPAPGAPAERGVFDCFTVVREIAATARTAAGSLGYPWRAVLDYGDFTYAFCRTEQFPGEKLIPDPRTVVRLPAACRAA